MSKLKLLTIAVVVLLLLNVGLMAKLFAGKRGHHGPPPNGGPKALVIERLHLNAEQVMAYEALIATHREAIALQDEEMMATRKLLYENLLRANRPASDSLTLAVGYIQRLIEQTHCEHFAAIRTLCKPEQIEAYDELVVDLADLFSGPGMKPKR